MRYSLTRRQFRRQTRVMSNDLMLRLHVRCQTLSVPAATCHFAQGISTSLVAIVCIASTGAPLFVAYACLCRGDRNKTTQASSVDNAAERRSAEDCACTVVTCASKGGSGYHGVTPYSSSHRG